MQPFRIGHFEALEDLSSSEAARVYRGRGPDGAPVCIKVFNGTEPEDFARFQRERRLLASFGAQEGYVPLLEASESAFGPYFIMPFLGGGSLRGPLLDGPLEVRQVLALGMRLGSALGVAHERGIVHRDMKPENVLFDDRGLAFIADLGLAKHFRRDVKGASQSLSVTDMGDVLGSAGYMAPEQILGEPITPRTDVFSLATILHECLTGRPVFTGKDIMELGRRVVECQFDRIGAIRDDVPVSAASVIETALSRDTARRHEDGKAFARALSRAQV